MICAGGTRQSIFIGNPGSICLSGFKPDDRVVQQAVDYAWVNHGKETCRILVALMDSTE
jgi:hypothetical protein